MQKSRRALMIAAVMAALLAVTGSVQSGSAATAFSVPEVGVVRLHMANDGKYVRFDPAKPAGGYTVGTPSPIAVSACNATVSCPRAVTPTPAPNTGKLGLVDNGLGVQVKGEGNGTPCGRVDGLSQALTLQLAAPLATDEMDYAELDIEVKGGGTVRADLYYGPTLVGTELLATTGVSDSGPDSADGDNYRFRVPPWRKVAFFNKIVLKLDAPTPGGAFSWPAATTFYTAPQSGGLGSRSPPATRCSTSPTSTARSTAATPPAGASRDRRSQVTRLPNGLGGCVAIPYIFRTGFQARTSWCRSARTSAHSPVSSRLRHDDHLGA